MAKSFGMDDMAALAGGAVEEMAAFRPSAPASQQSKKKRLPNETPDVSQMSAAETAALLQDKKSGKLLGAQSQQRHRTTRTLAHHALAQELSDLQAQKLSAPPRNVDADQLDLQGERTEKYGSEVEEEFLSRRTTGRTKVAPQIVTLRKTETSNATTISHRRKRRPILSSGSSSSDESSGDDRHRRGRRNYNDRKDDNSSSSSSDDEERSRRRLRLQANRKRQEPQIITKVNKSLATGGPSAIVEPAVSLKKTHQMHDERKLQIQKTPTAGVNHSDGNSTSSNDSSSSSGSSGSSSESSDSSDEDMAVAKPIFVPKHKRNLINKEEQEWEREERRIERQKLFDEKRSMESRALVAKSVASVQEPVNEDIDDEAGGATNAPPNDDDDDEMDQEQENDKWEVRELHRLLLNMDVLKRQEKEQIEVERRRQMTDEEVLEYDKKHGKYQAPGSNRQAGSSNTNHMQRFFHRGAFYMDKDEFDENDIRLKAAEYARAATGEDKIDKSTLPEVMQVKGFGLARQNMKYKGLAKEDTTDKTLDFLPVIHKKK